MRVILPAAAAVESLVEGTKRSFASDIHFFKHNFALTNEKLEMSVFSCCSSSLWEMHKNLQIRPQAMA